MEIKISIEYPRPLTILVLLGILIGFAFSVRSVQAPVQADLRSLAEETVFYRNGEEIPRGGPNRTSGDHLQRLRLEQQVLAKKTKIIRDQILIVERMAEGIRDSSLRDARHRLLALFNDERVLEKEILISLREMQTAHERAQDIAQTSSFLPQGAVSFLWPVEPRYGVSAGFHDKDYLRQFGIEHEAIDIPIEQGSIVYAAADGIVQDVSDRGMGFSSLTIAHNGGVATLYGHIREFLVMKGQKVRAGDPIARSGGMPGTKGAGMLSTGPHLHFEVIAGDTPIDPLVILPDRFFGPTVVGRPTENPVRPGSSA